MNILFLHQNMPGQFKSLAPLMARDPDNRVVFLTTRQNAELPGVGTAIYKKPRASNRGTHHYLVRFENAVRYGQQVARGLLGLKKRGFEPDLIIAHPGWGEALFCKDIVPEAKLINLCEFYYGAKGRDIDFDPEFPTDLDAVCRTRARNAHLLSSLESCDAGVSPTEWQKSAHPEGLQDKIEVIFDGIDIDKVKPDHDASFTLPDGRKLTRKDKVVTYAVRNLEPYRGFHSFMRAIPAIQRRQPDAEIVIVGGDEVSYGAKPEDESFANWREAMEAQVVYDSAKVHFTGRLPYDRYLSVLQISSAHVYLTYPFVLSWSCLEAMACEALVIGSATPPVEEVIVDGENGLLTDFFNGDAIAEQITRVLDDPSAFADIRRAARQTIVDRYALDRCLPRWLKLIEKVTNRPQAHMNAHL
ncbi:MAG: glycosyltransferase family 4 protein [Parasphingopyxis sp.]